MPTLDWIGKQAVVNHDKDVPFRLLKRDAKLSVGDSENLLIKGDNLEALKALLPYYVGRVKCIYIDPPYNKGNEAWIYNDNVNTPEIRKWLGKVVGKEQEDLTRHDKWLCMMYPRIKLLRELLRGDGVIFVSIDDTEVGHLRMLMDEIFGVTNFLSNCIWQKKYTRANDARYFSDNHDHILCYAKSIDQFQIGRVERTALQDKAYKNPDNHPLGSWKPTPLHAKSGVDKSGYRFRNGAYWKPPIGTFRRFNDVSMSRMDLGNEIWFGVKGDAIPQRKTFLGSLEAGLTPVTLWQHEVAGDNHIARDEVKEALSHIKGTFDNPKPTSLIQLILQLAGDKDGIILDSFAGSGTTGHAVIKLNKEDGGNRRFILVEIEDHIATKVTAERLRSAINGYTIAGKKIAGIGGGFQFMRLDTTLFDANGDINKPVTWLDLARYIFFTDTQRDLDQKKAKSPYIGSNEDTDYFLLFSEKGKNTLTRDMLSALKGTGVTNRVVYADRCLVPEAVLTKTQTTFKQIPYNVRLF